jgi:hypothetical protein
LTEIIIGTFLENKKEMHLESSLVTGLFLLFHRWIILILGYVVRLEVAFILDGEDRKLILRRGFGHVEQ